MSLFMQGGNLDSFHNNGQRQMVDEGKIKIADIQYTAQATTYNNSFSLCLQKCIPHDQYSEGDLTKGETVCLERCVSKFLMMNFIVGQQLAAHKYSNPMNLPVYEALEEKKTEQLLSKK